MKKILFAPNRRHEIKESFKSIIDMNWQQAPMFDEYNNPDQSLEEYLNKYGYYYYLLQYVYHTFYDDHMLHEKEYAMNQVDGLFYTEEEARRIYEYCSWFHDLTEEEIEEAPRHNTTNSAYFDHPEWPRVISEGKAIVKMMEENEKKYDIDASWARWS